MSRTRDHNESMAECALISWWLHRTSLYRVVKNWWKARRFDAETIERMVRDGRNARKAIAGAPHAQ